MQHHAAPAKACMVFTASVLGCQVRLFAIPAIFETVRGGANGAPAGSKGPLEA